MSAASRSFFEGACAQARTLARRARARPARRIFNAVLPGRSGDHPVVTPARTSRSTYRPPRLDPARPRSNAACVLPPDQLVQLEVEARLEAALEDPAGEIARLDRARHRRDQHREPAGEGV